MIMEKLDKYLNFQKPKDRLIWMHFCVFKPSLCFNNNYLSTKKSGNAISITIPITLLHEESFYPRAASSSQTMRKPLMLKV